MVSCKFAQADMSKLISKTNVLINRLITMLTSDL